MTNILVTSIFSEMYWEFLSILDVANCSYTPCQNGGNCTDLPSGDYECSCGAGINGTNCEIGMSFMADNALLMSYYYIILG